MKALQNTTQKASEMAKLLNCQLGQPIVIKEIENEEHEESTNIQAFDGLSIRSSPNIRILKTTLSATYELLPITRKS